MVKQKRYIFQCRHGESPEEKSSIAREMALLKILEGKLPYRTPRIDLWRPNDPMFAYPPIPGITLNSGTYLDFSRKQQLQLADDLARCIVSLQVTIPPEFAQAIGFTFASWPLHPNILKEVLSGNLIGATQSFFEDFLEVYREIIANGYTPTCLHHDIHGGNIIVHPNSGRLRGIIDFEDFAIGDPYQEFRLLYEIDSRLMEETAEFYAQRKKQKFDIRRTHAYYLATEYSRMVEIMQGNTTKYRLNEIAVNIMMYEEKYGSIPKRRRMPPNR